MDNTYTIHRSIRILVALLLCTANLTFLKAGPVSVSFIFGLLLIFVVYSRFPMYARIKQDIRLIMIFSLLAIMSIWFSPVAIDGTSLYSSLQIVYWFIIANIFSNINKVIHQNIILKVIIFVFSFILISFILTHQPDGGAFLSENESSFIVVVLWPLCLFFCETKRRIVYILFVIFLLFVIGSRTGIIVLLIQLLSLYFIKKIKTKNLVRLLVTFVVGFLFFSNSSVRLYIAEALFPEDNGMQMVIEHPEMIRQMDKSWVQRRLQQEKCQQVAAKYPFIGIGPLNIVRFNFNINVSKMEDVDSRILDHEYSRSMNRSSHNSYYQLLAENGFVGLIIILFVFLRLLIKYYKRRNDDYGFIVIMVSLIGMIINLYNVSSFWGTNTWIMLGLYTGFVRNQKKLDNENINSFK